MHLNEKGQSKSCVHLREIFAPKYLFKCDYMHGVVCQQILLLFVIDYPHIILNNFFGNFSPLQMADQQQEHQRETEGLLDSIRELRKELQFETKLIESFIPLEFQVRLHPTLDYGHFWQWVKLADK